MYWWKDHATSTSIGIILTDRFPLTAGPLSSRGWFIAMTTSLLMETEEQYHTEIALSTWDHIFEAILSLSRRPDRSGDLHLRMTPDSRSRQRGLIVTKIT